MQRNLLLARASIAMVACLLVATSARGQGAGAPRGVFRSTVDLVALNVTATDTHDHFVTGLTQQEFMVLEDNKPQSIALFAASDVPLDVALLIDLSASMGDKLALVQQAAINFTSHLREGDRVTVVGIKGSAKTIHGLDGDIPSACEAIRKTRAGGTTALYTTIYTTIREMAKLREENGDLRRAAIVVLSDGEDTTSLISADDVLTAAKASNIAIYTIALKASFESFDTAQRKFREDSDFTMKALAFETGARSFFPADITQLAGVYESITDELAHQYVMAYSPSNSKRDGTYRHISVRLLQTQSVRIRTRAGYQAPGSGPFSSLR